MTVTQDPRGVATAYERLVDALDNHGSGVRHRGTAQASAQCPAHEDRDPSLSIRGIAGQVLVYCHAGCDTADVVAALGLSMGDLFDEQGGALYRYESGRTVKRWYEYDQGTARKKFAQFGDLARCELYHLDQLRAAGDGGVFLVEGEKDVHAIEAAGGVATTAPQGASNFGKVDVAPLAGRHVTAVVDRDAAGAAWAATVAAKLAGVAARVRFVQARAGKDAADHIAAGFGVDDFEVIQPPASAPAVAEVATNSTNYDDRDDFWQARRALAAIRSVARDRMVSPWATLGGVLAIVCSRTGPHVVLPPIVGSVASINTFWAMVGASGGGKDAATDVARELLWLDDHVPTHEVGTGQGIDSTYTVQTKEGPVQFCDAALFTVSEIDTLAGHSKMSGSTVMATLRKVYSGSSLGARYAEKEKRRPVRPHHYRAALIAGVQPARSAVLLGDADGGTPQRWLWLPTDDPGAAAWPDRAAEFHMPIPAGGLWRRYPDLAAAGELADKDVEEGLFVTLKPRVEIKVCETAREAVIANRRARLAAGLLAPADDLSGHALLTRLKVAALLGLLDDGRTEITEEDWQLSGVVMAVSDGTRAVCASALAESSRRANVARAYQAVEREEIAAEHTEQRVAAALGKKLRRAGGEWVGRSDLRRTLSAADRPHFDSAIDRLISAGQAEAEAVTADSKGRKVEGSRYRAAGGDR